MDNSVAKKELSSKAFLQLLLILGPFFLFLSLSLSHLKHLPNYDLWVFIPLSFLLMWKYSSKGFFASFALLIAVSTVKHFFLPFHFWQLGLEATIATGLLITYYSLAESSSVFGFFEGQIHEQKEAYTSLQSELLDKETSLQNEKEVLHNSLTKLEDDLRLLNQKNASLQGLTDTLQIELNSITTEKNTLFGDLFQKNKALKHLKFRYDDLQIEQAKLQDAANLKRRNHELLNQLNTARVDKYQTHLINEMLARLLSKEARRVKEALDSCHIKEMQQGALQQNLQDTEKEVKTLCLHFEGASNELDKVRADLQKKEAELQYYKTLSADDQEKIQNLSHQFEEQSKALDDLRYELKAKEAKAVESENSTHYLVEIGHLKKEIKILEQKLEEKGSLLKNYAENTLHNHHMEAAHIQLRKQFEEKSEILHQTRAELFQAETNLQALLREKETNLFSEDETETLMAKQLLDIEDEVRNLERERDELLSIVTELMHNLPKKKSQHVKK